MKFQVRKPKLNFDAVDRTYKKTIRIIRKAWRWFIKWTKPVRKNGLIWVICMTLLVSSLATLLWAPHVGVYLNALALAGLAAVALVKPAARKVAISLAIIPTANSVTASVLPKSVIGSTVVFYAVILAMALIYRYVFTLEYPTLKTQLKGKGYALGLPLMVVVGQIMGLIGYAFLRHHYPYTGYSLPLICLAAIVFAFAEETLLRGLIQQQGEILFHPLAAALSTTVLYVFLVLDHSTLLTLPVATLFGGLLSFVYYKKKNLLLTFTLNAAAKLAYIGLVAGFILRK